MGKLDDQIFLNCFEANQEVRILLYKSEGFMLPGDFFAEFFRRVDSKGELTLTVKNGKSTGYIYVVLDAKTHKELYPDENDCPKRSWSQLKENVTARITFTDGTPLRLRDKPSTVFGDIVDEFDEGTRLKITNGPICSQEYLWWQVSVSGVNGWMAEGDGKVRFLEPWK